MSSARPCAGDAAEPPAVGADEAARLATQRSHDGLGPPSELMFDALTKLAAEILKVPIALVSFAGVDNQWFTSRYGLDAPETSHDVALLCGHVVSAEAPVVIEDVLQDERFSHSPVATGDPPTRFYAGVPLRTTDGFILGAFCAIDHEPRQLTEAEVEMLALLAGQVVEMLELQRRHALSDRNLRDELIRREARLAELEPHRQLFDMTLGLLCKLTSSLRFDQLNPAWETVLGWTPKDLCGQPFLRLVHPNDLERIETVLARLLADSSTTVNFKTRYRHRNGSWVPLAWVASSRDGILYCVARNIGSYGHADNADRLKSQFISTVSHELRTPLTTIRGALGLVAKGITGPLPERAQEYVDIALANSERLVRLINDILDLEKIQSGGVELNIRPVDLASVIEKAVEQNKAFTDSLNVTLSFVEEVPDIEVLVDEDRLIQVLTNLISNAAEFSTAGQSVELSIVKRGALVRVQVCDRGRGISDEFRARIFQRFAQEDSSDTRRKGGTGLGLHISRALIEGMNGKIGFESVPGHETTFFFDLPFTSLTSAAPEIAVRSEGDSGITDNGITHIRVLHVEDDRDLQQIVKDLLPADWAVTDAMTVANASALLRAEPFDLVLLDLALPDGSGETLLDQVGDAEVVVFSASEVTPALAGQVTSALVKSRITEFQLRDHVLALMETHTGPRRSA